MTHTGKIPRTRIIAIRTIYTPGRYNDIAPGSTLLDLEREALWRVSDITGSELTVFPYNGGSLYTLRSETSSITFGLIEDPAMLPDKIFV